MGKKLWDFSIVCRRSTSQHARVRLTHLPSLWTRAMPTPNCISGRHMPKTDVRVRRRHENRGTIHCDVRHLGEWRCSKHRSTQISPTCKRMCQHGSLRIWLMQACDFLNARLQRGWHSALQINLINESQVEPHARGKES